MRRAIFALLLAAGVGMFAPARADAAVAVSLSYFHDTLAPHGRWVVATSYGDVWVPSVAAGWAPYVDGDWAYTNCGWTWVSDESWGDIPYHYGTWAWVDPYGWVWIPGTVWAPAWVTWAYTDDYIGWAPVPPTFALSASGYVGRPIVVAQTRYVFVPARQFVGVRVASVRVPARENAAIFARATKITRFPVSGGVVHTVGVPPARIERAAGRRIEPVPVERAARVAPTTIAQARVGKSKRLAVVAPAVERERVVRGREAAPRSAPSASADRRTAERARTKENGASRDRGRSHAAPAARAPKPHEASPPREPVNREVARPQGNRAHEEPPAHPTEHQPAPAAARPHGDAPRHAAPGQHHEKPKPDHGKPEEPGPERR